MLDLLEKIHVALALSAGAALSSLELSALFVLSVAEIRAVPLG